MKQGLKHIVEQISYPLRAQGLLLADGVSTVGRVHMSPKIRVFGQKSPKIGPGGYPNRLSDHLRHI